MGYVLTDPLPQRPAPADSSALIRNRLSLPAIVVGSAFLLGVALAIKPFAGFAALILVAVGLALYRRPQISVYLMVTVAPAAAGLERGLVIPGLRISEAAVAGLGILVLAFCDSKKSPRWSGVEITLLAYAALTAVVGSSDLIVRHAPLTAEDLGTLLGPFQFVLLLRAVVVALTEERHRRAAAHAMLAAATVVGVISLAQFANLGPTRTILHTLTGSELYASSLGEGVGRVTGPFYIWHELAGFLMPSILLAMALMIDATERRARLWYALVLAVTGAALLSAAVVGATIATALGCLYICWRKKMLHVALAATLPVVAILAIVFGGIFSGRAEQQYQPNTSAHQIPFAPKTLSYRYGVFKEQSEPVLKTRWALGYGPDLPPRFELGDFPYTETTYVTLLLRGGVPLLAVFLLLIGLVIRLALRGLREATTDFQWSVAIVVLVTTVAFLFLQLIESYLLDSGPPHAYWAFVGFVLAAIGNRHLERPGAREHSPR
jgi:hypothetical protein